MLVRQRLTLGLWMVLGGALVLYGGALWRPDDTTR